MNPSEYLCAFFFIWLASRPDVRGCREDLNQLVKRHIQSVVSNSPARAVTTLESETLELIGSGMDTLNGKLAGVEEEKLVGRVVELWGFFWDQVLPYVEGVRVLSFYFPLRLLTT